MIALLNVIDQGCKRGRVAGPTFGFANDNISDVFRLAVEGGPRLEQHGPGYSARCGVFAGILP